MGNIANLKNHYLFRLKPQHEENAAVIGERLQATEGVIWAEKQVPTQKVPKPAPIGRKLGL